ncbi:hypothetical protein [Moorena producens]
MGETPKTALHRFYGFIRWCVTGWAISMVAYRHKIRASHTPNTPYGN